jgi:hypothetical protein
MNLPKIEDNTVAFLPKLKQTLENEKTIHFEKEKKSPKMKRILQLDSRSISCPSHHEKEEQKIRTSLEKPPLGKMRLEIPFNPQKIRKSAEIRINKFKKTKKKPKHLLSEGKLKLDLIQNTPTNDTPPNLTSTTQAQTMEDYTHRKKPKPNPHLHTILHEIPTTTATNTNSTLRETKQLNTKALHSNSNLNLNSNTSNSNNGNYTHHNNNNTNYNASSPQDLDFNPSKYNADLKPTLNLNQKHVHKLKQNQNSMSKFNTSFNMNPACFFKNTEEIAGLSQNVQNAMNVGALNSGKNMDVGTYRKSPLNPLQLNRNVSPLAQSQVNSGGFAKYKGECAKIDVMPKRKGRTGSERHGELYDDEKKCGFGADGKEAAVRERNDKVWKIGKGNDEKFHLPALSEIGNKSHSLEPRQKKLNGSVYTPQNIQASSGNTNTSQLPTIKIPRNFKVNRVKLDKKFN